MRHQVDKIIFQVSFPFGSGLMVQHINAIHPLEAEDDDSALFEAGDDDSAHFEAGDDESAHFDDDSAVFDDEDTFQSEIDSEEMQWQQQLQASR